VPKPGLSQGGLLKFMMDWAIPAFPLAIRVAHHSWLLMPFNGICG